MSEIELIEANNHTVEAVLFRRALIHWGRENFRPYPWRFTNNPYHILIAEVMLHRTQAPQVIPVYERFVQKYPDVASLANVEREELHKVLYSLGLRWRIDLIMDMVLKLIEKFGGQVPQGKNDLLSLPGVSEYVASAVRCFAWNLPEPTIDTNTVRVTGRIFNLAIKDSSRRNPLFRKLIKALVDFDEPRTYNYALLDLAAQVCTKAREPACEVCPVQKFCVYGTNIRYKREARNILEGEIRFLETE